MPSTSFWFPQIFSLETTNKLKGTLIATAERKSKWVKERDRGARGSNCKLPFAQICEINKTQLQHTKRRQTRLDNSSNNNYWSTPRSTLLLPGCLLPLLCYRLVYGFIFIAPRDAPHHITPRHTTAHHTMPHHTVPHHAMPCHVSSSQFPVASATFPVPDLLQKFARLLSASAAAAATTAGGRQQTAGATATGGGGTVGKSMQNAKT